MAQMVLKELHIPYNMTLEQAPESGEVMILEKNGEPIAAIVAIADFAAFQLWRAEAEHHRQRQLEAEAIEREQNAFQQMQPTLQQQYPGRIVAIHGGKVIAVGDDRMEVWQQARQSTNGAPIYVQAVESSPQTYKMPHRKVVRNVALQ